MKKRAKVYFVVVYALEPSMTTKKEKAAGRQSAGKRPSSSLTKPAANTPEPHNLFLAGDQQGYIRLVKSWLHVTFYSQFKWLGGKSHCDYPSHFPPDF